MRWSSLLSTSACLALVAGYGLSSCATGSGSFETSEQTTASGGAAPTSSSQGGAGTGGEPANPYPCGIDCATIETDSCHEAVCDPESLTCAVVDAEDGTECDDEVFCTVKDSCQAGLCVGAEPNDCGLKPAACDEVVCNEATKDCALQQLPDQQPCVSANLCEMNASCINGLCIGTEKDCFFEPVPNDCHVSVCNPNSGKCEAVAGNEGQSCVDPMDLCTITKTCSGGTCQGGTPKDCSQLTVGCNLGVCDNMSGQCTQQPVMEGQSCDDLNACTAGETCQQGNCGGGQPVTQCLDGDNCCPAICSEQSDKDCACSVDKLYLKELNIGNADFISIHNPTACPLDVNGLEILFDDSSSSDMTTKLPQQMIAANSSVYVVESGAVGTDIPAGGNIPFSPTRGGAVLLCNGVCSTAANVIDVVAFSTGEPFPALPAPISFQPSGLMGINSGNQSNTSWLRVATAGSKPTFLAADWNVGASTK